jgi:hypothetical protein
MLKEAILSVLFVSSRDSNKISLTFKGLLLQAVPVILVLTSSLAGFENWDETTLVSLINATSSFVALAVEAVSLLMVVWGLLRKLLP